MKEEKNINTTLGSADSPLIQLPWLNSFLAFSQMQINLVKLPSAVAGHDMVSGAPKFIPVRQKKDWSWRSLTHSSS